VHVRRAEPDLIRDGVDAFMRTVPKVARELTEDFCVVAVRDCRLGCTLCALQLLVVVTASVLFFGVLKSYYRPLAIAGVVRVQTQGPAAEWQFAAAVGAATAPGCFANTV
jgi:hypothetical protein